MKIKIWAFVLIVAGALLLGGVGGFAASQGIALAGNLLQGLRIVRSADLPRVETQLSEEPSGGWQGGQDQGNWQIGPEGNEDDLPPGFNAGVSIPAVYGEMTGRTEEQVQSAAQEAGTDVWGLAKKEGKLDELKEKVLAAVTASLDKMVADGKITAGQKDTYLKRVDLILEFAGTNSAGWEKIRPGGGPFGEGRQDEPAATAEPEPNA